MNEKVNFIVEADIKGFFDHVDHDILLRMLEVVVLSKKLDIKTISECTA